MSGIEKILQLGASFSATIQQSNAGIFFGRVVSYTISYPAIPAALAIIAIAALIFYKYSHHVPVKVVTPSITLQQDSIKKVAPYITLQQDPNKIIDDWIQSSAIDQKFAQEIKQKILYFLNNETETELRLTNYQLNNLPNIFGLAQFKRLKTLHLVCNRLTKLPPEIGNLNSLEHLDLNANRLIELPPEIGMLASLQVLNIHYNRLTELPPELGNLRSLRDLRLGHNNLSIFPAQISNMSGLQTLYLNANQLEVLPQELGNLPALCTLNLEDNQLRALPREIGNLRSSLRYLYLNNNPLTSLPTEILTFASWCTINIIGCSSLSDQILSNLREATRAERYRGPTIHFSMSHANPKYDLKSFEESLKALYKIAGQDYKPLKIPESRELKAWLPKLEWISDYKASPDIKKWLAVNILNYLALAEKDELFLKTFNLIIEEASKTCGDRMALSIVHLGIAYQLATIDTKDLKSLAEFLRKGSFAVSLIQTCALAKVKTLKLVDEIEVHLGYLVELKKRFKKDGLELPIDIQGMLFFAVSGITEKDLESAYSSVSKEIGNQDAFYTFLITADKWLNALQHKYPEKYAEAQNPRVEIDDEEIGEDHPDFWVVLSAKINEGLIALTKEALAVA